MKKVGFKKFNLKKLKLKSVYTRYMLVFMAIMFFTTAILGVLVTAIVGNYTTETKKKELYDTNVLFKTTVLGMNGEYDSLEEKLKAHEKPIRENLTVAFFAMSDCGVVITDNVGKVVLFAYREADSGESVILYGDSIAANKDLVNKTQISEYIMRDIYKSRSIFKDSDLDDFFSKSVDFYAVAISPQPIIDDTTDTDTDTNIDTDTEISSPEKEKTDENENWKS